ncbi:MAG: FG-GAP repeat protein [Planctomycetes bacterium]|nr:FG-GAP repeat protein [Planctomycetota bacterium]
MRQPASKLSFATFVALICGVGSSAPALAQCEITPLTADSGFADQKFGWSTAICGDYAVIGTDEPASSTGAAYIYERDGLSWTQRGRLLPTPGLAADDEYGRAVAIRGRVAVVGARKHGSTGAVYVFRRNSGVWEYEQKLTAADGLPDDRFGGSVAIDGDWIIVGAPDHDEFGLVNSGAAYAFHFDGSTWTQARKILADDQDAGDSFANAVAINGNWIVVGAKQDDDRCPGEQNNADNSGSVYTFFHDPATAPNVGWEVRTKLQAQVRDGPTVSCDATNSDTFGHTVAISGDRLVVGAVFDDDNGSSSGSAYVYRLEEPDWVIEQKLTASDGAALDNFGRAVAIHGDLVLVGASRGDLDNPVIADTGSVYLYRRAGAAWIDELELTASDAALDDRFGWYVSIGGDYAAVGAYRKNASTGSAYIFAVGRESDCDENGTHDDCQLLGNGSLDANGNGVLDSCECAIDDDCVGAVACLSGTCDADTSLCVFTVNSGFCANAGECFADGTLNPANDCEVCDHAPATAIGAIVTRDCLAAIPPTPLAITRMHAMVKVSVAPIPSPRVPFVPMMETNARTINAASGLADILTSLI